MRKLLPRVRVTMRSQIPRISKTALTLFLASTLVACSSTGSNQTDSPHQKVSSNQTDSRNQTTYSEEELQLIKRLQIDLPGTYSNFTQIAESETDVENTTDLIIRELISDSDTVFLFESQQRNSVIREYDLYWSQINPQTGNLELQFARLSGNELSTSMPETLEIAKKRALPGCVISLQDSGSRLEGSTNAELCQFQDPLNGQIHLLRSISIETNQLEIADLEIAPGELSDAVSIALQFQKHQAYQGTISIDPGATSGSTETGQWQTSTEFTFNDDGRVQYMTDADAQALDYTVRLSKMHWKENQPPYLRLDIIQVKTGEIQAYSWFEADAEVLAFEQDWVKIALKKAASE